MFALCFEPDFISSISFRNMGFLSLMRLPTHGAAENIRIGSMQARYHEGEEFTGVLLFLTSIVSYRAKLALSCFWISANNGNYYFFVTTLFVVRKICLASSFNKFVFIFFGNLGRCAS